MTDRDRRAIRLCVLVVGALLLGKFALLPWLDHWKTLREQAQTQQLEAINAARRAQRLIDVEERIKQRYGEKAIGTLQDIDQTMLTFHKSAQKLLQSNGIAVESLQPQSPRALREAPGVSMLSLRLNGKCQTPQIVKALSALRSAECFMFVDRIDLTADPKQPGQLSVTMTLATLAKGVSP